MRLGGRNWGDLQQLPSTPRPAHDPLGLKRPVLQLLGENIAVNSTAALELSRDAPGTALPMPLRLTRCAAHSIAANPVVTHTLPAVLEHSEPASLFMTS